MNALQDRRARRRSDALNLGYLISRHLLAPRRVTSNTATAWLGTPR